MTVTVVFGKSADGYLHSYDTTYATARNGPADGVNTGAGAWIGQNRLAGTYQVFESFLGYDYSAIPDTEIVTSAAIRTYVISQGAPSIQSTIEHRGYSWSSGGLVTGDWRTPTDLAAARLDGLTALTSAASQKFVWFGSDELLEEMRTHTSMEHVVVTARQRQGTTPAIDETVSITTAETSGTTNDPALVYTSAPRSTLFGVLGAQVRLSNGWAYLESNGAVTPVITLKFRADTTGTVTTIGTLPIGTGSTQFSLPDGAQALALVADSADNLFVLGRHGPAENTLAARAYTKGGGTTWSAQTLRTTAMPAHGARINQVAAAYHAIGSGVIFALVGRVPNVGSADAVTEFQHISVSASYLLTGSGTMALGSGNAMVSGLFPLKSDATNFNTWLNETGTGVDVATAKQTGGEATWGYGYTFPKGATLGDNDALAEGRYILSATGGSFSHASFQDGVTYGRKDAAGKVRVIPVSPTATAFLSTDSDSGWGITVAIQNHSGTNPGSTYIGIEGYDNLGMASMPSAANVAQTAAWDAIYNATENRIWIYYVDASNPLQIRKTAFDLNTMQAAQNAILVTTLPASTTAQAIRVQRNAPVTQNTLVAIATLNGTTRATSYVVDTFNVAPTAPTLTPKANFDAGSASTFAWTHNDPNPGDTQSAYELEITNASTGVVALGTGKVASTTSSRNVAGSTIPNGADYRWRVRTWDTLDEVSPWSDYGTFTATAGGSVTITVPATDNPSNLITDDLTVSWSVAGTTQAAYRVWLYRGSTLVSDSNWVTSTATSHTISGMLSDQQHEVRVQVRNASAVTTNTAIRLLLPSFSEPEAPLVSVAPNPASGYTLVTVDNPFPGSPELGFGEEGFESGVGTWTAGANSSRTAETTTVHRGTGALRIASTLTGANPVLARDYANAKPVTAGQRYTARMWVFSPNAITVAATIDWRNGSAAVLSSSSFSQALTASTWTLVQATGTAPAGAVDATPYPSIVSGPASGVYVIVDEVALTAASDRPDVSRNEILRRPVGETGTWEVLGECDPDGSFRDYTAASGVAYDYVARGQA